jgi:tRNA modification GTPase
MFSTGDTIVAIATPPGRGGIGIVRISGADAQGVARRVITYPHPLEPRRATFTYVRTAQEGDGSARAGSDRRVDQTVVTFFPGPASYTGEDVVEVSTHGSPVVLRATVEAAVSAGARLAGPGEFTLRAFLNGRIDLPQAEAVADLIEAVTPLQARVAFDQLQGTLTQTIASIHTALFDLVARLEASIDFPDEGYHFVDPDEVATALRGLSQRLGRLVEDGRRGRVIREGRVVAIVGAPNVGKSSLFNALVGSARAIVTPVPGTTRDLVTETIDLDGFRVTLVDTAGVRPTEDEVEAEGVSRSFSAARMADVVVEVHDGSAGSNSSVFAWQGGPSTRVVVDNKADHAAFVGSANRVRISATSGEGLDELRARLIGCLGVGEGGEPPEITNVRHIALLEQARASIEAARSTLDEAGPSVPEELVLVDLQAARHAIEEVAGRRTTEDVLAHIFERFCIGK